MTRFVIGPDVALHLARMQAVVPAQHQLLAPTLIRSQVLAQLYAMVQRGELDREAAQRQLDHLRGLRLRLLGDRVLQSLAWKIADQLGWPDTFVAEYLALTQLQADAFVCMDPALARAIGNTVTVATIDDLISDVSPQLVGAPRCDCR
jgi:predicted nucleic acid-binding protein